MTARGSPSQPNDSRVYALRWASRRCRSRFEVALPVVRGREAPRPLGNFHLRHRAIGRQYLGGRNTAQLQGQFGQRYFRGSELAGGDIGVGQASEFTVNSHGGQVVVRLLVQQ